MHALVRGQFRAEQEDKANQIRLQLARKRLVAQLEEPAGVLWRYIFDLANPASAQPLTVTLM